MEKKKPVYGFTADTTNKPISTGRYGKIGWIAITSVIIIVIGNIFWFVMRSLDKKFQKRTPYYKRRRDATLETKRRLFHRRR